MIDDSNAWRVYSDHFRREVLPKLVGSHVFLSIGKPVMLLVPRGRQIGAGLRRAADVVVEDWDAADADSQERITVALDSLREADDDPTM